MLVPFSETGKTQRLKGSSFGKWQLSKQLPLLPFSDSFKTTALAEGNALSNPSKAIVRAPQGIGATHVCTADINYPPERNKSFTSKGKRRYGF